MEGLLILIGIYVLDIVIKKVAAGKKKQQEQPKNIPSDSAGQDFDEAQPKPSRNLQDLIRQFEEAQRDASQGTYVPPSPEVEDDEEDEGLPVVTPAKPGEYTFSEIAESVVQWEYVSVELLQEAFGFSERIAQQVLAELQAKRIVGRDMGEGDCDLLVHDKVELSNHFKRLQREAEEQQAAATQEAALKARREAELKHQKELAELEERARQLREQAGQINNGTEELGAPCLSTAEHRNHTRDFNKDEIRRGFIWAKVLDEPRFKKRWSARAR
ncbi:MAG: hypothetical protein MJZ26_05230 [Fibrobacter sp.]|nr:hypothetical protein [Fibrobacter sp.]